MNVLLSVKPQYAEAIVYGRKKYEFRRSIFKRKDIDRVYIYSTSPKNKIIASFEIEKILTDSPQKIWDICRKHAGMSKSDFFTYFEGSPIAFAIKINNVCGFANPIDPHYIINKFRPPQSFYYIPINLFQEQGGDKNSERNCELVLLSDSGSGVSSIKNHYENDVRME
ncbi:MAG: ASCH domain-containing protein [Methanocellales archaeon]|nr:ASCH domain-containing protein [Methanocellales archaeon]